MFRAKNHTSRFLPGDIKIPKLHDIEGLCPVSFLNKYNIISQKLCNSLNVTRPSALWIGLKGNAFSKVVMRQWFREVILRAGPSVQFSALPFSFIQGIVASFFRC